MENNEITMLMDVKIDKKPECTRCQQWTRAEVKIEAVKCLPCFLRVSFTEIGDDQQSFSLSIKVPGVSITLASSRTKQHSYALCWTQNRKCCYIYFALDTELSCRRHMKWMKKSIKNLELHRKLLLDERRCSRGGIATFRQLTFDDFKDDSDAWTQRVSEIYEEIYEPQDISPQQQQQRDSRRVSRRCSRTSIASGIYEEMNLPNDSPNSFDAINEELPTTPVAPIPPPLPPLRKRFNTYETEEVPSSPLVEAPIPRCSTNPETDLAKKKKYKNMLDNIFSGNGLRSKRTVSTSESSQEHLASSQTTPKQSKTKFFNRVKSTENELTKLKSPTLPNYEPAPIYANDDSTIAAKRLKKLEQRHKILNSVIQSKRNSFSSPDLSKINFVDTFDEQRIAEMLNPSFLKCDDFDLTNSASLDESLLPVSNKNIVINQQQLLEQQRQNISTQLPQNFNFSACNTSSVNLIASLTSSLSSNNQHLTKNKIIHDDLTGYCVMAPIVRKMAAIDNTPLPTSMANAAVVKPLESVSSGYSTGSYSSTASYTEEHQQTSAKQAQSEAADESVYMNMQEPSTTQKREIATPPFLAADFTGNLYENLLAIKAARELEPELIKCASTLSTSTPTESPLVQETINSPISTKIIVNSTESESATKQEDEEESFYQTPRKSIISIDEKIPSYYPNTCETSAKSRRRSYSPAKAYNKNIGIEKTPTSSVVEKSAAPLNSASSSSSSSGLRQLVSSKLRRERKENLYLTSPQGIIEQRKVIKSSNQAAIISTTKSSSKTKKTNAHKISENVYAVKHRLKKSVATTAESYNRSNHNKNNNNNIIVDSKMNNETAETENDPSTEVLEHLAILRNIDFKFEDTKFDEKMNKKSPTPLSPTKTNSQHHLQVNQSANTCYKLKANSVGNTPTTTLNNKVATTKTTTSLVSMTQSAIANAVTAVDGDPHSPTTSTTTSGGGGGSGGVKKFASLPRFKKFDLSPLRLRINNVLQRHHTPDI